MMINFIHLNNSFVATYTSLIRRSTNDIFYLCFSSLGKVFLSEIGDGSVDVLDSCVWYSTSGKYVRETTLTR